MPQIVIDNASKHYGAVRALDGVHLAIEDNVTTAIVGPSGGGKSTLLQLINGLVRPTRGRVVVFGEPLDYRNLRQLRLRIGYAVQGVGLFPHMTVWDNVTLLARLSRWQDARTRERAYSLMTLVGLDHELGHRYPHELSGGQQQRVALCRAMMLNPSVFLLDEPFGAVDPITRREIQNEFLALQTSEARTIILVTHDVREAFRLATRMVIVDKGRVVREGSCREVADNPGSEFAEQLIRAQLEDAGRTDH